MKYSEDRILELALQEELGGPRPPDLVNRVRWAVARGSVSRPGVARRSGMQRWILAGSAAALLGVIGWLVAHRGHPEWRVTVRDGVLEWQSDSIEVRLAKGEALWVAPLAGTRIRPIAGMPATLHIQDLGFLRLSEDCELEVEEMDWKSWGPGLGAGTAIVAVITGAAFFASGGSGTGASAGERLVLAQEDSADLEAARRTNRRLSAELAEANRRIAELEAPLEREPMVGGDPAAEAEAEEPPLTEEPLQLLLRNDRFRAALQAVDWRSMGVSLVESVEAGIEIARLVEEGGEIPAELLAKARQANGAILELLLPVIEAEVPGEGGNAAFSHPMVAANAMHTLLNAAGVPLSRGQLDRLQEISDHYASQDENLRIAGESHQLALETFLGEMEMKKQFFGEVEQIMSAEQQGLIYPDAARDRSRLELFGVGGDWGKFARAVPTRGPDDFAGIMTVSFQSSLGLSEMQTDQVRGLMSRWARTFPPSYWSAGSTAMDRQGNMTTGRIHQAAERQIALLRELMTSVDLTPEQRAVLERSRNVLVPLPR